MFAPWKKSYDKPRPHIKKQRHYLANKGLSSQGYVYVMYAYESWTINKAERQRIDAFELWCWRRFLRVPWTARRSDQSILKEISPEYSLEGLILKLQHFWPPDAKNWLIGKDLDAGKDWRQEKGTIEDKMVGWHHQLDRHEFEQTLGESEGQGMLACCSSWGHKESDMTEQLNWSELIGVRKSWATVAKRSHKMWQRWGKEHTS